MRIPSPATAFLIPDCACSGSCAFCFYRLQPERRVPAALDLEGWRGVLSALAQRGLRTAIVSGGEPTELCWLEELVAHGAGLGLAVVVLSGQPLEPARARSLAAAGLAGFVLSAQGPETVEASAPGLRSLGACPGSVTWVFHATNVSTLEAMRATCARHRLPMLLQPAWFPAGHPRAEAMDPRGLPAQQRSTLRAGLEAWGREAGLAGYARRLVGWLEGEPSGPPACAMGRDAFVIDADGAVMPCFHRRDLTVGWVGTQRWGDLLETLSTASRATMEASCSGGHCLSLHLSP
jgi:MoaA/NifB/PqqE/SkfB family radical SAM enzyme